MYYNLIKQFIMTINVNLNKKINFSTPIVFSKDFIAQQKPMTKALIAIGTAADIIDSFDGHYIQAPSLRKLPVQGYAWKTALKVAAYVLTAFILPAIALFVKTAYKYWALNNIAPQEQKPNKPDPIKQLKGLAKNAELPPFDETPKNQPDAVKEREIVPKENPIQQPKNQKNATETDKSILENLERLTQEINDEEKLNILFELEKLSQQDVYRYGTIKGQWMKKFLYPEPTPLKDVIGERVEGQIFVKNKNKPTFPDKFYDLSSFADFAIQRIIKRNAKNYHIILAKLNPEQQKIMNRNYLKLREHGPVLEEHPHVYARSDSGRIQRVLVQFDEDESGHVVMQYVNKQDFVNKTPHPRADEKKDVDAQAKAELAKQTEEKNAAVLQQLKAAQNESISGTTKINIV